MLLLLMMWSAVYYHWVWFYHIVQSLSSLVKCLISIYIKQHSVSLQVLPLCVTLQVPHFRKNVNKTSTWHNPSHSTKTMVRANQAWWSVSARNSSLIIFISQHSNNNNVMSMAGSAHANIFLTCAKYWVKSTDFGLFVQSLTYEWTVPINNHVLALLCLLKILN